MSNEALWKTSDAMLDSLSLQLREAESRRAEAERAHQEALAQLRGMSSGVSRTGESYETLQSRARELEKKAALETVRCEELQLELKSTYKTRSSSSKSREQIEPSMTSSLLTSSSLGQSSKYTMASTAISSIMTNNTSSSVGLSSISGLHHTTSVSKAEPSTVTWAPTPDQKSSEIDRIMAKIEQDNRILAELEQPRTTGPSSYIMTSSGGLASSLVSQPPLSLSNISTNLASSYGATAVSLGAQSSGTTSYSATTTHNLSPLPIRANQISTMPPLCQSSTMPVLSLHNTYTLPSGSASYTLGLSGAPVASSYTYPTVGQSTTGTSVGLSGVLCGTTGLSSVGLGGAGHSSLLSTGLGTTGLNLTSTNLLPSDLGGTSRLTSLGLGYNTSSYSTYTNPLITSGAMKLKTLDDFDIGINRYNRGGTPCSPIPGSWGLDSYSRLDGVNPGFMHSQSRPLSRLGALDDLDGRTHGLTLNGNGEPQVDMLDIPGKGRCCVFMARFSYDPPDVEGSEGELALCAGDYLLVWGNGEPQSGYYDAELLDGRRGLVPASFVQRLVGDDLLEFHQAVVSTLRDADDMQPIPLDPAPMIPHTNQHSMMMPPIMNDELGRISDVVNTDQPLDPEDEMDPVPAPRHLTLERQLNKSVLIGWNPTDQYGNHQIESYHVYVDGNLKVTVKAAERTRALVEGVDCNRPHRVSVRSVTANRRTSRDAACTMIIGRDVSHLGPTNVKATNITCSSAVISWLPANSNHQHVVCVNNVEVRTLKPGVYRHTITGLSPSTQYRVTVRAKQLRAPGQQPPAAPTGLPPHEEAPGAYTDFRTLAKGLPDPPQEIQVEPGPQDGTLLVTWLPVNRPPASGPVTGYAVYADGKKVTDVDSPTGDHALIDITKLVGINPQVVTVRTKSRDAQSADSMATPIPQIGMGYYDSNDFYDYDYNYNQDGVRNAARTRQNQKQTQQLPQNPQQQMQMQQQNMNMKMMGPMNKPMDNKMGNMQQMQNLPGQPNKPNQMKSQKQNVNNQQQVDSSGSIPSIEITKENMNMNLESGDYVSDESEYQEGGNGGNSRRNTNNGPPSPLPSYSQHHQSPQHQYHQQNQPAQMQGGMQGMQGGMQGMQSGMQGGMQSGMQSGMQGPMQGPMQGNMQSGMQGNMQGQMQSGMQSGMQGGMGMQGGPMGMQGGPMQPGMQGRPRPQNPNQINQSRMPMQPGQPGQQPQNIRGPMSNQQNTQQRKLRYFLALFDYDPITMSPNPESCEEELPFREGDTIKVYGDKDPDGFYWGELRGRRGYVPHNMVQEIEDGAVGHTGPRQPSVRGISRDRWGDIYANMPVRRMVALYDYDPQELSPNVDAEVELSFQTGQVILVYGDMDEDGFYMGELDGIRGLVPSNFLAESDGHNQGGPTASSVAQRSLNNRGRGGMMSGPGARGPPPPPRDNMMGGMGPRKDNTGHPAPDHQMQGMQPAGNMQARTPQQQQQQQQQQNNLMGPNRTPQQAPNQQANMMGPNRNQQQPQTPQQQQQQQTMGANSMMQTTPQQQQQTGMGIMGMGGPQQQQQQQNMMNMRGGPANNMQQPPITTSQSTGLFSSSLFSGPANAAGSMFGSNRGPQMGQQPGQGQSPFGQQPGQPGQPGMNQQGQPSMLQKLGDMASAAPGGDMLSKGKELIFMKFGLGGK